MKSAGCSRGSAPWSAPRHGPAEPESAPVRRQRRDRGGRKLRRRSCGARLLTPNFAANSLTTCHTSFSVTASPQTLPALLTRRKRLPVLIPAAVVQSFNRPYTQSGTGIVPPAVGLHGA